jgi:hypothetical protein
MRAGTAWSRDVVLKAMCDDNARYRKQGAMADFIAVPGYL